MEFETDISREIKILSEVEKIWILHDVDKSGSLDFHEMTEYIQEMSNSPHKFTEEELRAIYNEIDTNGNNFVEKKEMIDFLRKLSIKQKGLSFKQSYVFQKKMEHKVTEQKKINE